MRIAKPRYDRAFRRLFICPDWSSPRIEGGQFALRQVDNITKWRKNFGWIEYAIKIAR